MNNYNYQEKIEDFTNALLKPSMHEAIKVSKEFIKCNDDIKPFWESIIVPSMYAIGDKWANGKITVGQEHTATSICQRVMAEYYEEILNNCSTTKKVIVTTSPKELHQIGARMVADLLELNGFDVEFLDSSCSIEDILDIISNNNVRELIISTTLVSNLESTENLISDIKKRVDNEIKIFVGGQAYTAKSDLKSNADFCITDFDLLLNKLKRV